MALRFKSPDPAGNCCGCRPDPCDDCPSTECGATLECEGVSATGTKEGPPGCAWAEFTGDFPPNDPIKYFLKYKIVATRRNDCNGSTSYSEGDLTYDYAMSGYEDDRREIEWSCVEHIDPETGDKTYERQVADVGSAYTWHQERSGSDDPDPASCTATGVSLLYLDPENTEYLGEWELSNLDCGDWAVVACTMANPGGGSGVPGVTEESVSPTEKYGEYEREPIDYENDFSDPGPPAISSHIDYHATQRYTVQRTLSDEWTPETTESLIERVTEDLPGWDEAGGGCTASRNLSDDESSYSIRKFRWRIVHPRPGSGAIEVILLKTFTPEDGGTPTTSFLSYTWSGDPEGGEVVGSWNTIDVPDTDGVVSLEVISINCAIDG